MCNRFGDANDARPMRHQQRERCEPVSPPSVEILQLAAEHGIEPEAGG
jgi:hypothetical protein